MVQSEEEFDLVVQHKDSAKEAASFTASFWICLCWTSYFPTG